MSRTLHLERIYAGPIQEDSQGHLWVGGAKGPEGAWGPQKAEGISQACWAPVGGLSGCEGG